MLTVLPDELIVHVIEQVADLHAAFNLHFGTVVDSLVRGSYPASALRPLLPLCCVSRRLRTICLPIAMRDIYFNARPSHECMVRFPADDSTRSMRNRVAEDYIFSHPEVSSLVQNLIVIHHYGLPSKREVDWLCSFVCAAIPALLNVRHVEFGGAMLEYGYPIIKTLHNHPSKPICSFAQLTSTHSQAATRSLLQDDSMKLHQFIIRQLAVDGHSDSILTWPDAGIITPSISAFVNTNRTPKWVQTRFNGLRKLALQLQAPSGHCSLEQWDNFVSQHPTLHEIQFQDYADSWIHHTTGGYFPLLRSVEDRYLLNLRLEGAIFERRQGEWDMTMAALKHLWPSLLDELASALSYFASMYPAVQTAIIRMGETEDDFENLFTIELPNESDLLKRTFSPFQRLRILTILNLTPVTSGVDDILQGLVSGQFTEFTIDGYIRRLFLFCMTVAAAMPSLECICHYQDVELDSDSNVPYTNDEEPQWVCEIMRNEEGAIELLNATVLECHGEINASVAYSYRPAAQ